jgi:hypothetical protein
VYSLRGNQESLPIHSISAAGGKMPGHKSIIHFNESTGLMEIIWKGKHSPSEEVGKFSAQFKSTQIAVSPHLKSIMKK